LTPEEQARLAADALEQATPELRRNYETAPVPAFQRVQLKFIREAHIRNLLGLPPVN
jgi:hypothetical protein